MLFGDGEGPTDSPRLERGAKEMPRCCRKRDHRPGHLPSVPAQCAQAERGGTAEMPASSGLLVEAPTEVLLRAKTERLSSEITDPFLMELRRTLHILRSCPHPCSQERGLHADRWTWQAMRHIRNQPKGTGSFPSLVPKREGSCLRNSSWLASSGVCRCLAGPVCVEVPATCFKSFLITETLF